MWDFPELLHGKFEFHSQICCMENNVTLPNIPLLLEYRLFDKLPKLLLCNVCLQLPESFSSFQFMIYLHKYGKVLFVLIRPPSLSLALAFHLFLIIFFLGAQFAFQQEYDASSKMCNP